MIIAHEDSSEIPSNEIVNSFDNSDFFDSTKDDPRFDDWLSSLSNLYGGF